MRSLKMAHRLPLRRRDRVEDFDNAPTVSRSSARHIRQEYRQHPRLTGFNGVVLGGPL